MSNLCLYLEHIAPNRHIIMLVDLTSEGDGPIIYTVFVSQPRVLCVALGVSARRPWKTDMYSEEENFKQCHENNSSLGRMYRITGKRDLVLT